MSEPSGNPRSGKQARHADIPDDGAFLAGIASTVPAGIVAFDADAVIVYANPRVVDLLDTTPDELVGEPAAVLASDRSRLVAKAIAVAVDDDGTDVDGETLVIPLDRTGTGRMTLNLRSFEHRGERYAVGHLREATNGIGPDTDRLEWINGLIRGVNRAAVTAETRESLAESVCESLIVGDRFAFAWIGDVDPEAGEIEPIGSAGGDDGDLNAVPLDCRDATDPAGMAARTGEAVFVRDVSDGSGDVPWQGAASIGGFRSILSLPLVYDGVTYGVLSVVATEPTAFDAETKAVLGEIADTVAGALNAIVTKRSLQVDTGIRLEFRYEDATDPLQWFAAETGCTLTVEIVLPHQNDTSKVLFIAQGGDQAVATSVADENPEFESLRHVSEQGDATVYEAVLDSPVIETALIDHGAAVVSISVTGDGLAISAEVPRDADVRGLVDRVREQHPGVELVSRRRVHRPIRTRGGLWSEYENRLTDRQREVLRVAYMGGYFDWPRERTGEEIADSLGISGPAVNRLLRRGQKKLLDLLYERG